MEGWDKINESSSPESKAAADKAAANKKQVQAEPDMEPVVTRSFLHNAMWHAKYAPVRAAITNPPLPCFDPERRGAASRMPSALKRARNADVALR